MIENNNPIKKIYLTELLSIDKNSVNYESDVNKHMKYYKKISCEVKLESFTREADIIYKWLYDSNRYLSEIVAKGRKIEEIEEDLKIIFNEQKDYYNNFIKKAIYEKAMRECHSISDVQIVISEGEYENSINTENFIYNINEKLFHVEEFTNKIIMLFSQKVLGKLNSISTNIDKFEVMIEEAIHNYEEVKKNYSNMKEQRQLNPYLNLYMYIMGYLLKRKYSIEKLESYIQINNIIVEQKKTYGIEDAVLYLLKLDIKYKDYKKVKQNMYKCFENIEAMKKFKKSNMYVFPYLSIPVAYYLYFSRKNIDYTMININKAESRVEPIIRCCMYGKYKEMNTLYKLLNYIQVEVDGIFNSINHRYEESMLGFLSEILVNAYYRTFGIDEDIVYWSLKK
ncbi:hypothetical protein [Clostridium gasigenes]|uniref:Uncharacterized protein n=1 Tax=Clostridium gasigenes TaxID=94869 RepID=A0A1H0S2I1_9CLOT|nr:hypothetical protein [Clostridium gasigenes]SDP35933.1 hypothetical protein SAMN04488529_104131 [Clostridium gasigenes]